MKRSNTIDMNCKIIGILYCLITLISCKKFIEVETPRTQLVKAKVFENNETAVAALSGIYSRMYGETSTSISYLAALSADELSLASNDELAQFYQNSISSENSYILDKWNASYNVIYLSNSLIEGLENSTSVPDSVKIQLISEAKFIRAFTHFNLTELFCDVPYITSTNYEKNGLAFRFPVVQIYDSLINELEQAGLGLADNYSVSKGERVRANRFAALALLSRVKLFKGNWTDAERIADAVINDSQYELDPNLEEVFLKNSKEAILQLMTPKTEQYTFDASRFINPTYLPTAPKITTELLNIFDSIDQRRVKWLGLGTTSNGFFNYPLKYKQSHFNATGAEYLMVLRLAEQFLIRAEARAMQNKLAGDNSAASDINTIRARAGLEPTTSGTQLELVDAIIAERRKELFTEWGDRWFTLKRLGRAEASLSSIKTGWNNTDTLYPIPRAELLLNPNLTPNPGY